MAQAVTTQRLVTRARLALVLVSAGLFCVFVVMAVEINARPMAALDAWVWRWFDAHRSTKWQGDSNQAFAFIGRPVHVAIAGFVSGTALSLWARSVMRLVVVTGAVGAGAVLEQVFKRLVERTPANLALLRDGSVTDWSVVDLYTHTFPSGHVTGAATLFGMIAVCLGIGRTRAVKVAVRVPAVIGVVVVAVLALYVRAHIFTDVLGGMVLGGALVAFGAAILRRNHKPYSVSANLPEKTRS